MKETIFSLHLVLCLCHEPVISNLFHRNGKAESGKVDVSQMTWEHKERVLRYLFARMNSAKQSASPSSPQGLPRVQSASAADRSVCSVFGSVRIVVFLFSCQTFFFL